MEQLVATLAPGRDHVLRLPTELEAQRALEYLAGGGATRPPHYAALDRDWLETEAGGWIRRDAIVELRVVSCAGVTSSASAQPA